MKSFDSVSINSRMLEILSQNPDWKAIVNDSVVSAILKTTAEANAELARYMEYLFKESKWDTAQNLSSVTAASGQLGYRPARKKSAFGEIYISADPRIHLVGRTISKDDFLEQRISWGALSSLVSFNSDVTIVDSKANSYVMTSRNELAANAAYVSNSVIQGVKKIVSIPVEVARVVATRSKLDPYLFIPVRIDSCENAGTATTQGFFRVFVNSKNTAEEYRVVDTLHLSTSADKDVEVYSDLYDSSLLYLKFNTSLIRGKALSLSEGSGVTSIDIHYIETAGAAGNLDRAFETFTISNIAGRSNLNLYGINLEPIVGGADEEQAYNVKQNAPTYYMRTYTAATQEAYENLISKIDFGNGRYASRVRVYPGLFEDTENKISRSVTYVTLLLEGLEDLATSSSTEENPYDGIERTINFYLSKLKAPTDTLKFAAPTYVGIGLGISCTANREDVENLADLRTGIQSLLDAAYGARSDQLDFGRAVYEADIVADIKSYHPAILSVKTEVEAITKLSWATAVRMLPISGSPLYTTRLNFSFSPLFRGSNFIKGFKDYRSGASYVLRFDIMYKQALASTMPAYHTTIFVQEDANRPTLGFYAIKDISLSPIWDKALISNADYHTSDTADYSELSTVYQFYYKDKVYSDDAFERLVSAESLKTEAAITDYNVSPGALSSFFISYSGDSDAADSKIGEGFIEFDITSIYATLQRYAEQDPILRDLLLEYPLANIKCNASGDLYRGFINNVLSTYVEVYVSARPVDKNLVPSTDDLAQNSVVLYADSADTDSYTVTNLSSAKKERVLSVECELV